MKNIFVLLVALLIAAFCLAGCEIAEPDDSDVATNPPMTEAPETEPPVTENGTVLSIDELRELNYMTADEVEAQYGARKYEYTMNGGTPVYSIESLPGVFLVYSGYGSINDGYEPIVGDASGIILTDGYAGNIHGVYVGMDLSSADIEWDAINLSLNSGLSLVKTFGNLGITVGIRDAEGDIPNESNTTEEWDAWKTSYKEKPTGFIHSIYVVLASETATIPEINEADYVVKDGVLTSYVGTSIVVNIPDTVKEIAANAFANSPVASSITEINIGANVEEISTEAFENLPNLKRVNVADANPKYRQINIFNSSNRDGSSHSRYWAWFKEGVDAAIYRKDNFALPMELNSIPTNSPDEVVTVLCDGAELKISFIETQSTEKYAAQLHSIKYGEQVLDFDDPLPLKGNFRVYSFNFAEGYVFKRKANHDEAYIFTKDGIITMLRGNARTNGVITLSCDETGNLIYHKENVEFASDRRQTADPFSNIITGPDYYFGEDGRVEIVNGELVFITEVTYTVEDFINSQGMTMEEWFERFALFNPGSLEELYQFNKENPYDWWKSRRVYYDTTVDFRLWGYNGEDTVLNLPTAIKSINDNAFSNSPAADKITEINIGPNVEKISINAFAGLPSLVKVNIDPANPYFTSDGKNITSADGSFSITIRTSAVTEPPVTEPPVTEAPTANPIGSFEFEKFIPEDKKDPDCTVGFILQAQKFTYLGNDIVLLHITNTTRTDYAISLTVKYLDSNGKTIHGLRDKYEDFGAGWDNYLVYDPDFAFDSFSCSLTISSPCKNSVTKYLTDGGNSILFSTESSGYSWLDRSTGESRSLNSPNVAAIAGFPHVNEYSESLHYIADYILFDKDGNIIFYDKSRIPGIAAPGENIDSVPVYLSDTRWSQKDKATLPDNFTGEAIGIIAYKSVLTHDGSIPHSKKATAEEFGYYTFQASNGIDMPYRLFLPRNYDPSKKYSVVTIFHAHGSQGNDNKLQLRDVEKFFGDDKSPIYDCIVYSPQCPLNGWWLGENVDAAMEGLDFINSYYSTDKSRQYFTGTSMGGCGVWNVLSRYPEKVSAAIPCAYYGGFGTANEPYGPSNPATQPAISPEMLEIPICYIYSAADETIPAEGCRNVVAAFEAVNASNFSYEEQQGVDHGTLGASYISKYNGYRLLHWLLEVVRETE